MRYLIIFVLSFISCITSNAQSFKYEIIEGKNTTLADDLIKTNDGYLHFEADPNKKVMLTPFANLNKIKFGITINKLDEGMKEILSKDLFNGEKRLVPWLYRVFEFNNKTFLLYHDIVSEEQSGSLKLMEINKQTAEVISEINLIDFSAKKITFDTKKVIKNGSSTYRFHMSENKKKIMITSEPIYEKDERKFMYAWVYDEDFKMISEKVIDFKTVYENINIYSTIFDNSGNIFIAYREFYGLDRRGNILGKDGEKVMSDVQDDMKKLMIVQPAIKEQQITSFNLVDHSVYNMGLVYSPTQNKVFLLGTFCKAWDDNIIGVFHGSVDVASMKQTPVKLTNFSAELVKTISDDGFAKTKEKKYGLLRYFGANYALRGNGSVDIVMRYIEEETKVSSMNQRISTNYVGGDFLDAHLTNDNFTFTRIGRDINSPSTNVYLLFSTFSTGDNLMLFYNDNQNNIERAVSTIPKNGIAQNSEICVATIDKSGNVTRQRLLPELEGKSIGLLNNMFILSKNSFLILVQRLNSMNMSTKRTKFAKVVVE